MAYQVLVVEDNSLLLELYQHVLADTGCEVWGIRDGDEALQWLADKPPHLLILDMNLPGISGMNILKYARYKLKLSDLKIAVITANSIAKQDTLLPQLADVCLEKPVSNGELLMVCRDLLKQIAQSIAFL